MNDDSGVRSSLNFESDDVRRTIEKASEPTWCNIYKNGQLPRRKYFEKEDLTNEVHTKAFLEFRGNSLGELYKFSKRTALNFCLDDIRGWQSKGLRQSESIDERHIDEQSNQMIVELNEIQNQLNVENPLAYNCLFLFYYEGYSADEICKLLNINRNQFNYNKQQALKFLQVRFESPY